MGQRLIDADQMAVDESEAYMSAQVQITDDLEWLINFVAHSKIQRLIADTPTVDAVPVVRKAVNGYEGYYEVDQFGNVYGCDRVVRVNDNGREYDKPLNEKRLKQSLHSQGYKTVSLTKNGKTRTYFVHRIVAEAFIQNPNNLPMVNHKDEDKTNNYVENLEWCTAKYNNTYGSKTERQAEKVRGVPLSDIHKDKISKSLKQHYSSNKSASIGRISEKRKGVIGIKNGEIHRFQSIKDAADAVCGTRANITRSCNSKTRTAYGYKWEFMDDFFCSQGYRRTDNENR